MFMHLQSPPETASGPASVVSSRRRRPSCLRPVVVALAVALGWGTALAQEGPDRADGQVAGDASQLGTVHVREQAASAAFRAGEAEFGPLGRRPVQALPYSVQVIPETLIEDQQASSLTDLLKYMPSAQMQARGGHVQFIVRRVRINGSIEIIDDPQQTHNQPQRPTRRIVRIVRKHD